MEESVNIIVEFSSGNLSMHIILKIIENIMVECIIEWNSSINNTYEMFFGCDSIISLNLSHFDISNIKNISRMFYGCSSLNSLDISNFNTSSVTDMSRMFYQCNNLEWNPK